MEGAIIAPLINKEKQIQNFINKKSKSNSV